MAISNKNILITPNTSGIFGNQPNVVFTGADSSIGDSAAITLTANPQNTGTLNFSASEGQLFSISNNLTDGDIFTVNDVSGIPSLAIDASGIIKIAEYGGRVLLGNTTDDSTSSLQISGGLSADSAIFSDRIKSRTAYFSMNDEDSSNFATAVIGERNANDGIASLEFRNQSNTFTAKVDGAGSYWGVWTNKNSVNNYRIIASYGSADETVELKPLGTTRLAANKYGATVTGTINADSSTISGDVSATTFTGSGANLTNLNGSNISSGTVASARIANLAASKITSGTFDSARLPAGAFTSGGGTDSAAVIALIDSSYVQSRVVTGSINNIKNDAFTGNASTTAFGLSVTPADSDDVLVFVNGVLQHTNTYSLSGSTITLDSAPDSSSTIDIRTSLIHSTSISLRDFQNYIYTLSSTLDSVSGADSGGNTLTYDADKVDVYVNGARLVNGKDYTAGNGTQIVFDSALHAGNIIEVVSHSKATALEPELTSVDTSLDSAGANQAIYSFSKSAFRTFKFTAQLTHSSSSSFHSEEILLTHNGTTVAMTTYAQVLLDSNLGSFDASISGSNVQLKLSPTKTNVGIKLRGVRTPV